VSLPFFWLRHMYGFMWLWEYPSPLHLTFMYLLAFAWSTSIIVSRMYLGVHSPPDIAAGMIFGAIILRGYLSVCDWIDVWTISGHFVPAISVLVTISMLLFHPQTSRSYSFAESASLLGWLNGTICGSWILVNYFASSTITQLIGDLVSLDDPWSFLSLWCIIARYLLGICLSLGAMEAAKAVLTRVFVGLGLMKPKYTKLPSGELIKAPESAEDLTLVETFVKYTTYCALGFTTTLLSPLVFRLLHLS